MERLKYLKNLPKKHSGSGVVFFNKSKEILLVKPVYKEVWILPGGVVEKSESPRMAAVREVKEEIGLHIKNLQMVCLDWKSQDIYDNYQFIFYGGALSKKQIAKIVLQNRELSEYKFFSVNRANVLLSQAMARRLKKCLKAINDKKIIYLEDQK